MVEKRFAVFGIYQTSQQTEVSVDRLLATGFSKKNISLLLLETDTAKVPGTVTTGVGVGGVIGGTLGLLVGIGALAVPGFAPMIAAGPISTALASTGVGASVGGIIGALVGFGIFEHEAQQLEKRIHGGGVLLSVHCDSPDDVARAKDLLKQMGAEDISWSGQDTGDYTIVGTIAPA